jgi:DNA-binding transcriptional LysR family regulator
LRLKNANRIDDTTPNGVRLRDPSTVTTIQAVAEAAGVTLAPEYAAMSSEPRSGPLLPDHLVAQQQNGGSSDG